MYSIVKRDHSALNEGKTKSLGVGHKHGVFIKRMLGTGVAKTVVTAGIAVGYAQGFVNAIRS